MTQVCWLPLFDSFLQLRLDVARDKGGEQNVAILWSLLNRSSSSVMFMVLVCDRRRDIS